MKNKNTSGASSQRPDFNDAIETYLVENNSESTNKAAQDASSAGKKDADSPASASEAASHQASASKEEGGQPPAIDNQLPTKDRAMIFGADLRWASGWALRFIIMVGATVLLWRGLAVIWVGLLPVLLAILVCTVLWPPVAWLRKLKFPPALAVLTVILSFFAIIAGAVFAMIPSIKSQSGELAEQATDGFNRILDYLQGAPFNLDLDELRNELSGYLSQVGDFLQSRSSEITSSVFSGLSAAGSIAVTLALVLVLTFFFLKDGDRFLPMVRRMSGPNVGWHLNELLTRAWNTVSGFIRTQAIVSAVDAIFIGLGLVVLQVPLALVLGVMTFFGGFIPIVGAFTVGTLAVVVALVSNGLQTAILVLILIVAVQQIEGNVLQPILQSKAMNLHAAVVLLAVTVGSTLYGIVGAFLAVPVAAAVTVAIRYHQELISLRAGEITLDDMHLASAESAEQNPSASQAWFSFKSRLRAYGNKEKRSKVVKSQEPR